MSKAFAFSTGVRPKGCRSSTARLTSGRGCCRSELERESHEAEQGEPKMKSTDARPSIVFCHGLWADGSCFSKVIPTLQAEGHQVIAAQYALNTTADDVATVRGTL